MRTVNKEVEKIQEIGEKWRKCKKIYLIFIMMEAGVKKPSTPSKASAVSRGNDLGFLHPKQPATFFNDYPSPCGGGMPPCGSDGSLPSRPQWTALFDLFDMMA